MCRCRQPPDAPGCARAGGLAEGGALGGLMDGLEDGSGVRGRAPGAGRPVGPRT